MKALFLSGVWLFSMGATASSCVLIQHQHMGQPMTCHVNIEQGVVVSTRPLYVVEGAYTRIRLADRTYVYDGSYRQMTLDGVSAESYARDSKGLVIPFNRQHFKQRAVWQCFKNDHDDICWRH